MTTTKSILQLSLINAATREVRKDFKGMAGDDAATTKRNIDKSTKNVVKIFSKLKVDPDTQAITGAGKDTIEKVEKWADRVARPFELGVKYGATAAFAWDKAFSVLVGRGVKEGESAVSLHGLNSANRAQNWTALRQEGLLGMLTRLPAAALGNLVGRCYSDASKAKTAKDNIRNATIGFNTAIRAATLTSTAAAIMMTGVLVGTGVSALASLVALPTLILAKAGEDAEQSAGAAKAADKPKQNAKADKAVAKAAAKAAAAPVAAGDISEADLKTLSKEHKAVANALQSLQPGAAVSTDKTALSLKKKFDAADAEVTKLRSADKIDMPTLTQAINSRATAKTALREHQDGLSSAQAKRTELTAKLEQAQKNFTDANQDPATQPEALPPLMEAVHDAKKAVESHVKQFGSAPATAAVSKAAVKKATAQVKRYQQSVVNLSKTVGSLHLDNSADLAGVTQVQSGYASVTKQWAELHAKGVVASKQLPLDAAMTAVMNKVAGEASKHLNQGLDDVKALMQTANKNAATHTVIKTMQADLAEKKAASADLTAKWMTTPEGPARDAIEGQMSKFQTEETELSDGIAASRETLGDEGPQFAAARKNFEQAEPHMSSHLGHDLLLNGAATQASTNLQKQHKDLSDQLDAYVQFVEKAS